MILSFTTKINGKPTCFVEKILTALYRSNMIDVQEAFQCVRNYFEGKKMPSPIFHRNNMKCHTIRKDEDNKWEEGTMIDFIINEDSEPFLFAPRIPVVSTQEIFMTRRGSMLEISIAKVDSYIGGDDFYLDAFQKGDLAKNDGFDEYNDFRKYCLNAIEDNGKKTGNYWFKGKIIHWTDLQY